MKEINAAGVEVQDIITGEYKIGNNGENDYRAGITLKAVF